MKCAYTKCGKEFEQRHHKQKACSPSCKKERKKERCRINTRKWRSANPEKVRLINDSRNTKRRINPADKIHINKCVICSKEYKAYRRSDKFCSMKCCRRNYYERTRTLNIKASKDSRSKNKIALYSRRYRTKLKKSRTITILKYCNHCNDYFKRDDTHWYIYQQDGFRDGIARKATTRYACKERMKRVTQKYHKQNPDIKRRSRQKMVAILSESYVKAKYGDKDASFPELYLKRNLLKLHRSIKQAQL